MKDDQPKYSSECDASDLIRASEIRVDKERYAAAMAVIEKKKKAINSIDDLRKKEQEIDEDEEEEEKSESKDVNINIKVKNEESLMTEEDKAQTQADKEWEKNQKKIRLK
jgi:hypothetical protein